MKAYMKYLQLSIKPVLVYLLFLLNQTSAQWIQTNGPMGGHVSSIAISGADMFVGTYGAGVYYSADSGTN